MIGHCNGNNSYRNGKSNIYKSPLVASSISRFDRQNIIPYPVSRQEQLPMFLHKRLCSGRMQNIIHDVCVSLGVVGGLLAFDIIILC